MPTTKLENTEFGNTSSIPSEPLSGQHNYSADIPISDQFVQPVESTESLISMSANAIEMDKIKLNFSALPEHTHMRGVKMFTQPNHQGRPADVHSAPIDINGVAIQTLRRGVEPGWSQAEGAGSSWQPAAISSSQIEQEMAKNEDKRYK